MATHTRPFVMTGAALASAAAIVAATPQLMSGVTGPSPLKLSQAQFEMSSFADLLALTPGDYANAYFQGYGGLVGNQEVVTNPSPPPATLPLYNDPYAGASWNIWAPGCAGNAGDPGNCYVAGLSGVAYQALDALINGGTDNVGALNYFFEAGFSAGSEYLAQSAFGQANPILSTLIQLAFAGPALVTQVWNTAWSTAASLVNIIPLVGPYVAGGIYAYLGFGPDGSANGYTPGLTGVLNYVIDLVTGNPTPYPGAATAAAATHAATAAASVAGPVSRAVKAVESTVVDAGAASTLSVSPLASAASRKAAPKAAAATESGSTETGSTPSTDTTSTDTTSTDTKVDTPVAGDTSTPSAGTSSTDTKPAPAPRKRPVRDAVEKVTSGISAALGSVAKRGAGAAGSTADTGSTANAG